MLISDVNKEIYEYLNSSKGTGYGSFDFNPNYKTEAIQDAIIDADYQVAVAIAGTQGNPHRSKFATLSTFAAAALPYWFPLTESDSDPEGVMIETTAGPVVAGSFAPPDKIKQWASNPAEYGGAAVIDGYYAVQAGMIIFTGVNCTYTHFRVPVIDRSTANGANELNSPDIYQATVVKLAAAFLLSKLEDYMGAAQMCEGLARTDIQNIKADKYFAPISLLAQKQE